MGNRSSLVMTTTEGAPTQKTPGNARRGMASGLDSWPARDRDRPGLRKKFFLLLSRFVEPLWW